MTLTGQERLKLAYARRDVSRAHANVQAAFDDCVKAIEAAVRKVNKAIGSYNAEAAHVAEFVAAVAGRLQDEYEGKSERWQEGDAGQQAREMVDSWDDAGVEPLEEVCVVMPDPPRFEERLDMEEDA